jgi:Tol biopolymer transport system component
MNIQRLTTSGKIVNAALSPDGKIFVYALAEANGQSLWIQQTSSAHPVNIAPPTKESYWGLTISPDGTFVYCSVFEGDKSDLQLRRIPILGGHAETLKGTPDVAVSFSPDGGRMAWTEYRREKTKLYTANSDGSNGRWLAERIYPSEFNVRGTSTAWSPDGATIACVVKEVDPNGGEFMSIVGVDAATGTEKSLTAHRWASVNHLTWLRDGSLIVIAGDAPGAPAQIWSLSPAVGELRQLTNDLNSYERLSATADGEMFLSLQRNTVARLSAAGENQAVESAPTVAQQVSSFDEIAWTSDGRIAYFSFAGGETNLWLRNADGSNPRQLTNGMQAGRGLAVSPDNRHIVFAAAQNGGKLNLWRTELDGRNTTRLTDRSGGAFPTISPDGESVIYQQGITSKVLRKIPLAGGASVNATEMKGARPQISPDGKLIAFFYIDDSTEPVPQWSIGIVSAEDGELRRKLTIAPTVNDRFLRWTPDGKAVAYISNEGDNIKIIRHSLDDAEPPRPLATFPADAGGLVQAFAWSPDGKQFAFTRESHLRDVVLLKNYKEADGF